MGFQQLTDYKATAENGHKALNNNLTAVRRQLLYKVEKQVGELGPFTLYFTYHITIAEITNLQ